MSGVSFCSIMMGGAIWMRLAGGFIKTTWIFSLTGRDKAPVMFKPGFRLCVFDVRVRLRDTSATLSR